MKGPSRALGPRRRLEIAILAFGAVFLVVLALSFRPGGRPSERPGGMGSVPSAGIEGQATTVLSGVDFSETLGGKPLFRIRSEKTIGFGPGAGLLPDSYALEKVALTVYTEEGTPVTVHADRAQYDSRTKAAHLSGNVRWADEDGSLGETERVDFDPNARVLTLPGPIHFTRGSFDLRASSGSYDVASRLVRMAGPIEGSGRAEGSGGLSALAADSALYRRADGTAELEGHVRAETVGGDRISADHLLLKTGEEGKRIEWARATGNVRGTLASGESLSLPAASNLPARGSAQGVSTRKYAADQAALFFTPSGDPGSLSLTGIPAVVQEPGRRVTARSIDVAFSGGKASSAKAHGDVRLRSDQGSVSSQNASLAFGADSLVETVDLSGDVRVEGEGRSASADRAVELPARGLWLLTGAAGSSASVQQGGTKVSAARIEIASQPQGLKAEGNARAVFSPEPGKKNTATLVGDSSRPTFGKGERIVFDEASHVVTLSGGATLWQGSSSLSGNDITLNEAERTVAAVGDVKAVLAPSVTEPSPGAPARSEKPSVVSARRMIYREREGIATFDGGVSVTRDALRATAERATAFLAPDRKLDRVELSGSVKLADMAAGRTGEADRVTDYPRQGKTVLIGSPARVWDAEGNKVAGAELTITERGRRVEVTAPEGGKTETIVQRDGAGTR